MPYSDTGGGRSTPQPVVKSGAPIRRKQQPAPYNPPPSPPPVVSNSSGQYSGGGGAPQAAPNNNQMGAMQPPGNQGPSPEQVRQQHLQQVRQQMQQQRQEKRQEKKKAHEFKTYLRTDSTYQDQLAALQKGMQDYIVSNQSQQGRAKTDFMTAKERLAQERGQSLDQMKNDFASRGLLNSSEFADAISKYDSQYNQQLGDLSTNQERAINDLLESLGLYRTQNQNERQKAKQEAIRRRTEKYGSYRPGG